MRLVLHTSHPLPGLRVDELHVQSRPRVVNDQRAAEAETRIHEAAQRLLDRGEALSVAAVAREANAHRQTVIKVLGTLQHTLKEDLFKRGLHTRPRNSGWRTG